jgi:hypothetical protein
MYPTHVRDSKKCEDYTGSSLNTAFGAEGKALICPFSKAHIFHYPVPAS